MISGTGAPGGVSLLYDLLLNLFSNTFSRGVVAEGDLSSLSAALLLPATSGGGGGGNADGSSSRG